MDSPDGASQEPDRDETEKSVTVIFNPVSGIGDPERRKQAISEALARHGYTSQFIATSRERDARELAKEAVEAGVDLLVVSGGDGTVMQVLEAVVGTEVPVAVVPSGTGNLLSVNLGVPAKVPDAIDVALSGRPFTLDLARASMGCYFAIMGGMGLDAQLIHDADREVKKRLGVFAYFFAALKNLKRPRAAVEIRLDDQPVQRRRAKTVIVANMGRITGGMEAMPTASPNDGKLDVGIVTAESLAQWLRLVGYALLGRTQEAPDIHVYQARKIHIRTLRPELVEFDGEEIGLHQEWQVDVAPGAVRIMLPHDAPAVKDTPMSPLTAAESRGWRAVALIGLAAAAVAWYMLNKRRR